MERRVFTSRVKQEGVTFHDFVVSLRELAKTCNFCNNECTQKNIRDQIIAGLADGEAVEALLKEKDLTLETTLSKCRARGHKAPASRNHPKHTGILRTCRAPTETAKLKQLSRRPKMPRVWLWLPPWGTQTVPHLPISVPSVQPDWPCGQSQQVL